MTNISVLIPTYNRHYKLARCLDYYQSSGFQVLIADGSEIKYSGSIPSNATYCHLPSLSFFERILHLLDKVETPQVVIAADDDFILTEFIRHADELLTLRPDISVVSGRNYVFKGNDPEMWYEYCEWAKSVVQNDAGSRLQDFFSRYHALFYTPTRAVLLREVFSAFAEYHVRVACLVEIMVAARLVIAGKLVVLDEPYTAREDAEVRWHPSTYPHVAELIAEDAGLLTKMDLLISQWTGASGKVTFERDILNPYHKIFTPWYRNKGRLTQINNILFKLIGKRKTQYQPVETFKDSRELLKIQQMIIQHGSKCSK